MVKKILLLCACALLAATGALYSAPSQATTGYYFVSVCMVPNAIDCPWGPDPVWFGPYPTEASCIAAHDVWAGGYFGTSPRTLSTCFPQ